jgi:SAM-dependent methyltransferase
MSEEEVQEYFMGNKLLGDDFNLDEIKRWLEDEKEGYANLGAKNRKKYKYEYHAINNKYGFRFLPDKTFPIVLGFGSAYGDEFKPILNKIERITIVEPSDAFIGEKINGMPITYIKPKTDGSLPFPNNSLDLITCFGVLHHVPNVSKVMGEFYRCLKTNGYALIREPIISQGDWREERPGLTRRERGIPINIFRDIISSTGFEIVSEKKCLFSISYIIMRYFFKEPFCNSELALNMDRLFCYFFGWNTKYHPSTQFDKLRPTNIFYVLTKPN